MASTEIDFQPAKPKKKGLAGSWEGFKGFCYNPETGAVCGRTGKSWAKIGLFYFVYYSCLAGFCALMAAIFFTTLDDKEPKQQGMNSLIKGNPGMAFVPMPDVETTLIKFRQGERKTYAEYKKALDAFLKPYTDEELVRKRENKIQDCSKERDMDSPKPCKFNITSLGDWCIKNNDYGYYEGEPCVLIKMNRVFGWEPEPYTNVTRPAHLAGKMVDGYIPVTCEGEQNSDHDSIGEVQFYPPGGFKANFFPYRNKPGHLSPIVMARFKNPLPGGVIQVWCKVWAQNIYHHKNDKAGSFRFELLVN